MRFDAYIKHETLIKNFSVHYIYALHGCINSITALFTDTHYKMLEIGRKTHHQYQFVIHFILFLILLRDTASFVWYLYRKTKSIRSLFKIAFITISYSICATDRLKCKFTLRIFNTGYRLDIQWAILIWLCVLSKGASKWNRPFLIVILVPTLSYQINTW